MIIEIDNAGTQEERAAFYAANYEVLGSWRLQSGPKVILGDRTTKRCRFCGKTTPEATFDKVAHAIPESLGNKQLVSVYECDECNEKFGIGIENDLGNWSKPLRTLVRIRGKRGVPTISQGKGGRESRIEFAGGALDIKDYEDNPIHEIDEAKKHITFKLKRDAYTPVAVLKAFVKIGLTLVPEEEISNFLHLLAWVNSIDSSNTFADGIPVFNIFMPGPMPNDLLSACVLRRKSNEIEFPYAFLVLTYGNDFFQVLLPSQMDEPLATKKMTMPPFPLPGYAATDQFGPHVLRALRLQGRDVVRGEIVTIQMHYESATRTI